MKFLKLIDKWFEEILISLFMGYFVFATVFQVIARFVLKFPAPWTEETAKYAFIWMTFIGSAVAVKNGSHVKVDILENALKGKAKSFVYWSTMLVFLGFMIWMTAAGVEMVQTLIAKPQQSPVLNISMAYVYGAMPVGLGLTVLRIIQLMVKKIFVPDKGAKAENEEVTL